MIASTNDVYCQIYKGRPRSTLTAATSSVLEIIIDGFSVSAGVDAMRAALRAATACRAAHGLVRVAAGNCGGNLGRHHFHLRDMVA
jgi:formylmethanofuran--tetrahydromethanopterin N-formyltransferase